MMNRKIEQLVEQLRDAIHEALCESVAVVSAMQELDRAGRCPALTVDVTLAGEKESPSIELVTRDQGLILTSSDEQFLRNIGIATSLA